MFMFIVTPLCGVCPHNGIPLDCPDTPLLEQDQAYPMPGPIGLAQLQNSPAHPPVAGRGDNGRARGENRRYGRTLANVATPHRKWQPDRCPRVVARPTGPSYR